MAKSTDVIACSRKILSYYQQDIIEDEKTYQTASGRWVKDYYVANGGLDVIAKDTGLPIDSLGTPFYYIFAEDVTFIEAKRYDPPIVE